MVVFKSLHLVTLYSFAVPVTNKLEVLTSPKFLKGTLELRRLQKCQEVTKDLFNDKRQSASSGYTTSFNPSSAISTAKRYKTVSKLWCLVPRTLRSIKGRWCPYESSYCKIIYWIQIYTFTLLILIHLIHSYQEDCVGFLFYINK